MPANSINFVNELICGDMGNSELGASAPPASSWRTKPFTLDAQHKTEFPHLNDYRATIPYPSFR